MRNLISKNLQSFSNLALHTHFYGTLLKVLLMGINLKSYLGVKWISLQQVLALELVRVCLGHHQGVLISLKDLSLVNFFHPTSGEVSFLDD